MYKIVLRDKTYQCRDDETLLEAFLRQGAKMNFSCQKGSCQVCMMHVSEGDIPQASQEGLKTQYISDNYFLPCQCKPLSDMVIKDISHNQLYHSSYVVKKTMLSDDVCQLLIDCDKLESYQTGQYINLCRPEDGMARSYSLASYQEQDAYLELHIQRMKNGELSNWIFDHLQEGDMVDIQGANGNCHYDHCAANTPLLMVAGDTGLAPLLGVLRQALALGHNAQIHFYHQVQVKNNLYMHEHMRELDEQYENFNYYPCVHSKSANKEVSSANAVELIKRKYNDLAGWRIYLAGPSILVSTVGDIVAKKGVKDKQIYSDAFDLKNLRQKNLNTENQVEQQITENQASENQANENQASENQNKKESESTVQQRTEVDYPMPDMEIWEALDNGKKLFKILHDFYTVVYADERLSPFFQKVTKQRSIEKVSLFMRQIFTGEKIYFGDRPKNAHHWMVISDELFDYREDIMEQCLRDNKFPEHLIKRWRAIEESFRPDIVKSQPCKKVVNGVELPLDGYEELELDSGSLCDSCNQAIEEGTRVRYHLRLGTIYCPKCMVDSSPGTSV